MRILPAIDLMGGKCVRLKQGQFDEASFYSDEPIEVAKRFKAAGARYLHMVDLDGAREGSVQQAEIVQKIVEGSGLEVQVGGGLRTLEQAKAWLDAGVERIVMGSLAVKDPVGAGKIIDAVGPAKVTLAIDVRGTRVAISGWKEVSEKNVYEVVETYAGLGITHLLCTDIERDGMMQGPNVELYRDLQKRFPSVEIQASGGIGSLDDLRALMAFDCRAVVIGKALYEGRFRLEEALKC